MKLMCILGSHVWSGCICSKCGKMRDEEHDWSECECRKCGKTRADLYSLFSILITKPLVDYTSMLPERDRNTYWTDHEHMIGPSLMQLLKELFPNVGFLPDYKVVKAIGEHDDPSAIPILRAAWQQAKAVEDNEIYILHHVIKGLVIHIDSPEIANTINYLRALIPVEYKQFVNGRTWEEIQSGANAISNCLLLNDKSADLLMKLLKPKIKLPATGQTGRPLLDLTGGRPDTPEWIALQLIRDQENPFYDEYTSWVCQNIANFNQGWIITILQHLSTSAKTDKAQRSSKEALDAVLRILG